MKKLIAILLLINTIVSACALQGSGLKSGTGMQDYTAAAAEVDLSSYAIGDSIVYGRFEQDNNSSNGAEAIEWTVIDKDSESLLLISRYCLIARQYHKDYPDHNATWETSSLRSYLNGAFYESAFTGDERKYISMNYVVNKDNAEYGVDGGNDTYDYVYLLSHDEAAKYFPSDSSRRASPTKYCIATGATTSGGYCYWWLRTPGKFRCNAEYIFYQGVIYSYGSDVGHDNVCVRPVIRLQKDAVQLTESISLDRTSAKINATESLTLNATVTPANSISPVKWSSSNTKVATVSANGKVTVTGLGTVKITAKSGDCSASCTIEVVPGFSISGTGGSVRVIDPYGLRFGIQLLKDSAYTKSKDSIVSYGTLIIPKDSLGDAELTHATPKVMDIPGTNIYNQDSTQLTYTGVLVGIPSSSFDSEIVGRGYLIYKDTDGTQHTIYTNTLVRSYSQVAYSAFDRYEAIENRTATEQSVYEKLKDIIESMS